METLTLRPPLSAPLPGAIRLPEGGDGDRAHGPQRFLWWSLLATGVCALAVATVGYRHGRGPAAPVSYHTETVTQGPVTGVLHLPAWLEPTATVRVGADITGRVTAVSARVGQRVRRGQVLARLDDRTLRAEAEGATAQAEASRVAVRQAQVKLRQIIYLLQRGDGDDDRRTELQNAAIEAEGELYGAVAAQKRQLASAANSRARLGGSLLRAPLDGEIVSRSVEPGETVTPGSPLFVIAADPSALRVVTHVGESDVARVRRGGAIFSARSAPGRTFPAVVTTVAPVPENERPPFAYRVQLMTPNVEGLLRPGMTVKLSLPVESAATSLRVPASAVRTAADGQATIMVVDDQGRVARTPVERGVSDGRFVEVLAAALTPGARVMVDR